MRRFLAGLAFAGILFTPGCGLRYEVLRPPTPKKKVVLLKHFEFKKPTPDQLPLPKALQKKPEVRFITIDSENISGDHVWLNSKGR